MSAEESASATTETPAEASPKKFDPSKYLIQLNGRGTYLEVKWRLAWLRAEHPDASIETELVKGDDKYSLFKATIVIPSGGAATGYGSETIGDFRDHMEKAETKSIGRALAALGFGVQFCQDHEHGDTGNSFRTEAASAPAKPPTKETKPKPPKESREQVRSRMEDAIHDGARPIDQRVAAIDWLFRDAADADRVRHLWGAIESMGIKDDRIQAAYLHAVLRFNPSQGG